MRLSKTKAAGHEPRTEDHETRLATAVRAAVSKDARRGPRALLVLGAVLQPLGGALILLGWSGAANTTDVWEQVPYLISGGVLGLGMMVAGGFCYFGYWQTEMVVALRRQSVTEERMLASLEHVEALLEARAMPPAAAGGRLRGDGRLVMRRGTAIGVLACLLVTTAACGSRATAEQRALARSVRADGSSAPGSGQVAGGPGASTTVAGGEAGPSSAVTAPGPSGGSHPAGATATTQPAPCQNKGATDVGVTSSQITLGNVATLSGPVPGIFQGGQIGAQAVAAYQNSLGGICGRQIKLALRDDKFDSGENRAQTIDLIGQVFGMVGSISLYDDAAAGELGRSGMPDMDVAITSARQSLANNFAVAPQKPGGAPLGPFNYLKEKYPAAIKTVGALWADAGSSTQAIEQGNENAARSVGFNIVYSRGYTATETDFTADVVRMRQNGVRAVMLMGADPKATARITGSMAQQGFKPDVVFSGAQAYDQATIALGGGSVDGIQIFQTLSLFGGEDSSIAEVALMNQWIQKVKPGFKVDLFAMYGWAEGRLLFRAMQAAGPDLTRGNVVAQLGKIGQYDGNGLLAPANPAAKVPATCFLVATIKGGKFVRSAPTSGYICDKGGYFRG